MAFLTLTAELQSTHLPPSHHSAQVETEGGSGSHRFLELTPPKTSSSTVAVKISKSATDATGSSSISITINEDAVPCNGDMRLGSYVAIHPSYNVIKSNLADYFSAGESLDAGMAAETVRAAVKRTESVDIPRLICLSFSDPGFQSERLEIASKILMLSHTTHDLGNGALSMDRTYLAQLASEIFEPVSSENELEEDNPNAEPEWPLDNIIFSLFFQGSWVQISKGYSPSLSADIAKLRARMIRLYRHKCKYSVSGVKLRQIFQYFIAGIPEPAVSANRG